MIPETDLQMMAVYNVPFMATHALLNPRVGEGGIYHLLV